MLKDMERWVEKRLLCDRVVLFVRVVRIVIFDGCWKNDELDEFTVIVITVVVIFNIMAIVIVTIIIIVIVIILSSREIINSALGPTKTTESTTPTSSFS